MIYMMFLAEKLVQVTFRAENIFKKSQRGLVWSNIYHTLRINNKEKKKGEREEEEGKNTRSRRRKERRELGSWVERTGGGAGKARAEPELFPSPPKSEGLSILGISSPPHLIRS